MNKKNKTIIITVFIVIFTFIFSSTAFATSYGAGDYTNTKPTDTNNGNKGSGGGGGNTGQTPEELAQELLGDPQSSQTDMPPVQTGPWDSYNGRHAEYFEWVFENTTTGQRIVQHSGRSVSFAFPSAGKWHIVSTPWCRWDRVYKITTEHAVVYAIDPRGLELSPAELAEINKYGGEVAVKWYTSTYISAPPRYDWYYPARMTWDRTITDDMIGDSVTFSGNDSGNGGGSGGNGGGGGGGNNPPEDRPIDVDHELVK